MPTFWLAQMMDYRGSCSLLNSGTNTVRELKSQNILFVALYRITINILVSFYMDIFVAEFWITAN